MEIPTPSDNPITAGKIKLGEQLFFDKRLSKAKDMSCETCHIPEKGWTDGLAFSKKFDGTPQQAPHADALRRRLLPRAVLGRARAGSRGAGPRRHEDADGGGPRRGREGARSDPGLQVGLRGGAGRTAHCRPHRKGPGHVRPYHPRRRHTLRQSPGGGRRQRCGQGVQGVLGGHPLHPVSPASALLGHALPQHGGRNRTARSQTGGVARFWPTRAARGRQARSARGEDPDGSLQDRQPEGPAAHEPRTSTMAGRRPSRRPPDS